MPVYLTHDQIDFAEWDRCLEKAANGNIYGYSWYLNIVSPGWDAIVKCAEGGYSAIMPIPKRKKFGLLDYVIQPIFTQQLGVYYSTPFSENDWEKVAILLQENFRFITSYSFNVGNTELLDKRLPGFHSEDYFTHHLNLKTDYQTILAGYRQDRRWRLNKARTFGLKVSPSTNIDLMLQIFDQTTAPRIKGVIGENYEYRMLRELYKEAASRNIAQIYEIKDPENQVLAMAMFFYFKEKIIYIFNTSSAEGKQKGAIAVLLDALFKQWAGQDRIFDFESPQVPKIASFYGSFGAEKQPFLNISLDNLPTPVRWLKQIRTDFYRKFNRK